LLSSGQPITTGDQGLHRRGRIGRATIFSTH
jgi:hypothetical protein